MLLTADLRTIAGLGPVVEVRVLVRDSFMDGVLQVILVLLFSI